MSTRISEADALRLGLPAPKRNKFNARAVTVDGIRFASKAEALRYVDLRNRERRGEIAKLECHRRFRLDIGDVRIATYECDFAYEEAGALVVEDVKGLTKKGHAWRLFCIKRQLMKAVLGIDVRIVQQERKTSWTGATSS